MSKSRGIALLGLTGVLFMAGAVAQGEITDGMGFYVRPSRQIELGNNPPSWVLFAPFEAAPSPPAQSDIVLTPQDPLTVLVPLFAHMPSFGDFGTSWTREGDTITINAYFFWMGGVTATIYGPHEYICPIGQLPTGAYRVEVNWFRRDFIFQDLDPALAADFLADPGSFATAHNVPVYNLDVYAGLIVIGNQGVIIHETHTFAVVPEPTSLAILIITTLALARHPSRRRRHAVICLAADARMASISASSASLVVSGGQR